MAPNTSYPSPSPDSPNPMRDNFILPNGSPRSEQGKEYHGAESINPDPGFKSSSEGVVSNSKCAFIQLAEVKDIIKGDKHVFPSSSIKNKSLPVYLWNFMYFFLTMGRNWSGRSVPAARFIIRFLLISKPLGFSAPSKQYGLCRHCIWYQSHHGY